MRVLITGAAGYVAGHVIEDLTHDHDLVLLSRQPSTARRAEESGAAFVLGDVTDVEDCLRALDGVDAVVHLAAIPLSGSETFTTNTRATYALLEAGVQSGVDKVVMASSNCALGHCFRPPERPFRIEYLPFDEDHPTHAEDSYGLSKLVSEYVLQTYAEEHGIQAISLRPAWCWGSAERDKRRSEPFDPAGGRRGFWAYIDMRDVTHAVRLALEAPHRDEPWWGAYFISAADTTADRSSCDLLAEFHPQYAALGAALEGRQSFFSWDAARRNLGFAPRHSWRDN